MTTVTGTVTDISHREVDTRYGMKRSYSITIDGERYSVGFKAPSVSVGDEVALTYDEKSKYRDAQSITKTGSAPKKAPVAAPTKSEPASYGKVFPVPPLHADRAIIRQNALQHASRLVAQSMRAGEPVPALIEDKVIKIARMFEAYATGDLDKAAAERDVMSDSVAADTPPSVDD